MAPSSSATPTLGQRLRLPCSQRASSSLAGTGRTFHPTSMGASSSKKPSKKSSVPQTSLLLVTVQAASSSIFSKSYSIEQTRLLLVAVQASSSSISSKSCSIEQIWLFHVSTNVASALASRCRWRSTSSAVLTKT